MGDGDDSLLLLLLLLLQFQTRSFAYINRLPIAIPLTLPMSEEEDFDARVPQRSHSPFPSTVDTRTRRMKREFSSSLVKIWSADGFQPLLSECRTYLKESRRTGEGTNILVGLKKKSGARIRIHIYLLLCLIFRPSLPLFLPQRCWGLESTDLDEIDEALASEEDTFRGEKHQVQCYHASDSADENGGYGYGYGYYDDDDDDDDDEE